MDRVGGMTGLGHNQPPPLEAFGLQIEDLFSLVSGSTASPVETDEQEAALDALLDDVRRTRKDADAQRAAEKKPHDDAAKAVQQAWKPLIDKCDAAADALKARLTPFREARRRAKDEAARKAREEAEARKTAAREALKASDDLEARFAAEAELKAATKLTAAANRLARETTGLRTYWEAEVTDRNAALLYLIQRSPGRFDALIQQLADEAARGDRGAIPGVIFHERKKAA